MGNKCLVRGILNHEDSSKNIGIVSAANKSSPSGMNRRQVERTRFLKAYKFEIGEQYLKGICIIGSCKLAEDE